MMCEVAGTPKFVVINGGSEVLARSKSKPRIRRKEKINNGKNKKD
jgi:hypothetical protein